MNNITIKEAYNHYKITAFLADADSSHTIFTIFDIQESLFKVSNLENFNVKSVMFIHPDGRQCRILKCGSMSNCHYDSLTDLLNKWFSDNRALPFNKDIDSLLTWIEQEAEAYND